MSIFGYEKSSANSGIQDGELVKCMFLDRSFPYHYKKEIEEQMKKDKQIAQDSGVQAEPVLMKHKWGGIAWNYAIIGRFDTATGIYDSTYKINKDELTLPDFSVFGSYQQLTPQFIHDNNLGFINTIKGGINRLNSEGKVIITQHFPRTLPEKDWATGISADQITQDNLETNKTLYAREVSRVNQWSLILDKWLKIDEEKAIEKLEEMISSRLLLHKVDRTDGKMKYQRPMPGLVFTAKVNRKGNYLELLGFEWNPDSYKFDYYNSDIMQVEEEDADLSEMLIKAREVYFSNLANKDKVTTEKEETPF